VVWVTHTHTGQTNVVWVTHTQARQMWFEWHTEARKMWFEWHTHTHRPEKCGLSDTHTQRPEKCGLSDTHTDQCVSDWHAVLQHCNASLSAVFPAAITSLLKPLHALTCNSPSPRLNKCCAKCLLSRHSAPASWLWVSVFVRASNYCRDDRDLYAGRSVIGTLSTPTLLREIPEQRTKLKYTSIHFPSFLVILGL
jgi:hypothetical protein